MVGTWSRVSLRLENLAGMVCPNEPIGPDGGGSFEVLVASRAGCCWPPAPVVVGASPPADGCRETGSMIAAHASSGVAILASGDFDHGCGSSPVLI